MGIKTKQILTLDCTASAKTLPTALVCVYSSALSIVKHPDDSPLSSLLPCLMCPVLFGTAEVFLCTTDSGKGAGYPNIAVPQ